MTATNIYKKYTSIYILSNEAYLDFFIITLSSSFLVSLSLNNNQKPSTTGANNATFSG